MHGSLHVREYYPLQQVHVHLLLIQRPAPPCVEHDQDNFNTCFNKVILVKKTIGRMGNTGQSLAYYDVDIRLSRSFRPPTLKVRNFPEEASCKFPRQVSPVYLSPWSLDFPFGRLLLFHYSS